MKRPKKVGNESIVSLFPFLAVLLCTMGGLVVILVVMAQQATFAATEKETAKTKVTHSKQTQKQELKQRAEQNDFKQQIVKLKRLREQAKGILDGKNSSLSDLEDYVRSLRQRLLQLRGEAKNLNQLKTEEQSGDQQTEQELKYIQNLIIDVEKNVKLAKDKLARQPVLHSIVPFEGRFQTNRRPIYLECSADKIVIQPEGITLTPKDFIGPNTPGNPLAAVIRATQEYYLQHSNRQKRSYPLMLVRPDGITAYFLVKQALSSLGPNSGYELIEQDWKMKYPEPDPTLANVQYKTLTTARQIQQRLAARNNAFKQITGNRYTTSTYNNSRVVRDSSGAGQSSRGGSANGSRNRPGQGHGDSTSVQPRRNLGNENVPLFQHFGKNGNSNNGQSSGGSFGKGNGAEQSSQTGNPTGSLDPTGANRQGTGRQGSDRYETTNSSKNRTPRNDSATSGPGGRNDSPTPYDGPGTSSFKPSGEQQNSSNKQGSSNSANSPGSGGPNNSPFGTPGGGSDENQQSTSLTASRGKNWGTPNATSTSFGVVRFIKLQCYSDQIVILSDDPTLRPKVIKLQAKTVDSIDEVISAVWKHMKDWGIAGKGMHWKPVLSFEVYQGGQRRYQDFQQLLQGSGIEMKLKK